MPFGVVTIQSIGCPGLVCVSAALHPPAFLGHCPSVGPYVVRTSLSFGRHCFSRCCSAHLRGRLSLSGPVCPADASSSLSVCRSLVVRSPLFFFSWFGHVFLCSDRLSVRFPSLFGRLHRSRSPISVSIIVWCLCSAFPSLTPFSSVSLPSSPGPLHQPLPVFSSLFGWRSGRSVVPPLFIVRTSPWSFVFLRSCPPAPSPCVAARPCLPALSPSPLFPVVIVFLFFHRPTSVRLYSACPCLANGLSPLVRHVSLSGHGLCCLARLVVVWSVWPFLSVCPTDSISVVVSLPPSSFFFIVVQSSGASIVRHCLWCCYSSDHLVGCPVVSVHLGRSNCVPLARSFVCLCAPACPVASFQFGCASGCTESFGSVSVVSLRSFGVNRLWFLFQLSPRCFFWTL